jgi:hypothetical protein
MPMEVYRQIATLETSSSEKEHTLGKCQVLLDQYSMMLKDKMEACFSEDLRTS